MTSPGIGGKPVGLPKSGGRVRGTPNKATMEVVEKLAALGCDPIAGLAEIAMDRKNSPELRARCHSELAQYLHPKRKPVDIMVEQPTVINVVTNLEDARGDVDVGNQSHTEP